jgi:regulator of cell morphogenesis and NO signaling
MTFESNLTVAEIAATQPATIKVFQQHGIDFCCGGKVPLGDACAAAGVNATALIDDLRAATSTALAGPDWNTAPLALLVAHIQARFHEPLRAELPRLAAMLEKVVSRHGDRHPEVLLPLQRIFGGLAADMLQHMIKEDMVLFPAIVDLERGQRIGAATLLERPIAVMEADHDEAGLALAEMRRLTASYMPPAGACPTFIGLYFGLAEFERDMHEHVHLENNILFPRAAALV